MSTAQAPITPADTNHLRDVFYRAVTLGPERVPALDMSRAQRVLTRALYAADTTALAEIALIIYDLRNITTSEALRDAIQKEQTQ